MSTVATSPTTNTPQNDPLAALRDIHLPEPISNWPPALGWWLLLIGLLLLVLLIWLSYRHYQRGAMKRAALNELAHISQHNQEQPQQKLQQLSQLLRRVALATHPRKDVAGLKKDEWLKFLDGFVADKQFSSGLGKVLSQGPYQKTAASFEADPLATLCGDCIKKMFKQERRHV